MHDGDGKRNGGRARRKVKKGDGKRKGKSGNIERTIGEQRSMVP